MVCVFKMCKISKKLHVNYNAYNIKWEIPLQFEKSLEKHLN